MIALDSKLPLAMVVNKGGGAALFISKKSIILKQGEISNATCKTPSTNCSKKQKGNETQHYRHFDF